MQEHKMGQKIYLIRHGMREDFENPDWPATAKEPHDTPLSAKGFRQAEDVGRVLEGKGIQAIYSSPFLRALQTADAIAAALDLPIRVEPGLAEWLNPVWMKRAPHLPSAAEAHQLFPRVDRSYQPVVHPVYPEIDETKEVRARVKTFWDVLFAREANEDVAVVAHGSPIGQSLGLMIPDTPGIFMQVASITCIERKGSSYSLVHSGIDHLSDRDTDVRFH